MTFIHAYSHPIRVEDLDKGPLMFVGPDRAGRLLEIGVVGSTDSPLSCMPWKLDPST